MRQRAGEYSCGSMLMGRGLFVKRKVAYLWFSSVLTWVCFLLVIVVLPGNRSLAYLFVFSCMVFLVLDARIAMKEIKRRRLEGIEKLMKEPPMRIKVVPVIPASRPLCAYHGPHRKIPYHVACCKRCAPFFLISNTPKRLLKGPNA